MYYLAIDVETGGIGHDKSLLEMYCGVYSLIDKKFELLDELDLKVKPNDGIYTVTGEALRINNINIAKHDLDAVTYGKAGELFFKFIKQYSCDGVNKLIPLGHGVSFDVQFLGAKILNINTIYKYVSYRNLDSGAIAQFFRTIGLLPQDCKGALSEVATELGVLSYGKLHTAKCDAQLSVKVVEKMIGMVENK